MERTIERVLVAREMNEGAGARVRRAIGTPELPDLDPFLLLDEFLVKPPAGFPTHPHKGFELITYMLEGAFLHEDSLGNREEIPAGGLQQITVGSGIEHSEMPGTDGLNRGLQLWVNLSRANKEVPPHYRTLRPEEVPERDEGAARVRLVAGDETEVPFHTPLLYRDITLPAGQRSTHAVPSAYRGFAYLLAGSGRFGREGVEGGAGTFLILGEGERLPVEARSDLRFVLVAGRPIGEPIRRWGPFVF